MRTTFGVIALVLAAALPACDCGKTAPKVIPHPKSNGEACTADSDCQSGLCTTLPGASGPACEQPCDNGCPAGDRCVNTGTSNGKTTYACAIDPGKLCSTCDTDADCGYPGDVCLHSGTVNACGQDCSGDGVCPGGYTCSTATRAGGGTAQRQCVPLSGTCACTDETANQARPCQKTNNFGTCHGFETCDPTQGYTGCDALTPSTEVCDGVDNDCNGQVDEGLGTVGPCGFGACQVTVPACANGVPQQCQPDLSKATAEVCDGLDNDCNGGIDDGIAPQSCYDGPAGTEGVGTCAAGVQVCSQGHWGTCLGQVTPKPESCDGLDNDCNGTPDDGNVGGGTPCNVPGLQGPCAAGTLTCTGDGGLVCTQTVFPATETCNGRDEDCDGVNDNGFDLNFDVNNCGACNRACPRQNGTPACAPGGFCSITCNGGFDDCNRNIVDGCEANLNTDLRNCGYCGTICSYANASATCDNGTCAIGTCQPGFYDLDRNATTGCEYACQFQSDWDLPDVTAFTDGGTGFVDANCDGLDGMIDGGIFVAPNGNDSNPGTMALPFQHIQHAINVAAASAATTPMNVYVASGSYTGQVTLASNVSLYGGYITGTVWQRSLSAVTTLSGANPVIVGTGVHDVTVQLVSVVGQPGATPSASSVGVRLVNSTNMLFDHVTVTGSDGAAGSDGSDGTQGNGGAIGANGQQGFEDSSGTFCSGDGNPPGPAGGAGGKNTTCPEANGGAGGGSGIGHGSGQNGNPSAGGAAGGLGVAGNGNDGPGDAPAPSSANGRNGSTASRVDGSPGANVGTFSATAYTPASGVSGQDGAAGVGGGGGGGGRGGANNCDSWGSSGAGGGAGGCGGTKGTAGAGGGASVAIWLYNTQLTALACDIAAGNGGKGGKGGKGGDGGPGAAGGVSVYGSGDSQDDGSLGGAGGHGADGAPGGWGGGGGGGPSFGVLELGGSSLDAQSSSIIPGQPGVGGSNPNTSSSLNGATGLAEAVHVG